MISLLARSHRQCAPRVVPAPDLLAVERCVLNEVLCMGGSAKRATHMEAWQTSKKGFEQVRKAIRDTKW